MSWVSLKYLEITSLKNQNKNLEDIDGKREKERKTLENKCKELVEKNNKLEKHVTGRTSLQGDKHLIWDVLITEAAKLMPYLDFILDKEIDRQAARQNVLIVKKVLNKKYIDTTDNAINFLNSLTEEKIRKATKLKLYLDFILDKEIVMQEARQNVLMVNQVLNKKTHRHSS